MAASSRYGIAAVATSDGFVVFKIADAIECTQEFYMQRETTDESRLDRIPLLVAIKNEIAPSALCFSEYAIMISNHHDLQSLCSDSALLAVSSGNAIRIYLVPKLCAGTSEFLDELSAPCSVLNIKWAP